MWITPLFRHGEVNPGELVASTDVTDVVKAKRRATAEQAKLALTVVDSDEIPNISPSLARLGAYGDWLDIYRTLAHLSPAASTTWYRPAPLGSQARGVEYYQTSRHPQ